MSEEWISIVPFTRDSFDGTKPPAYDAATGSIGTGTGQTPPITTPGSSATPEIVLTTDYLLRDENLEVITDEHGESISLEGLTLYAYS